MPDNTTVNDDDFERKIQNVERHIAYDGDRVVIGLSRHDVHWLVSELRETRAEVVALRQKMGLCGREAAIGNARMTCENERGHEGPCWYNVHTPLEMHHV